MNYDAESAVRARMNLSSSVLSTKSACNIEFYCFIVFCSFRNDEQVFKKAGKANSLVNSEFPAP